MMPMMILGDLRKGVKSKNVLRLVVDKCGCWISIKCSGIRFLHTVIKVLNISPATTREDLTAFFAYCGTIDKIQFKRDDYSSQTAFVTFRQPYAVRTALLLNNAILGDRKVKILQAPRSISIPITDFSPKNHEQSGRVLIPTDQSTLQVVSRRGQDVLKRARERARYTGKTFVQQANSAILAAEQTAGGIGSTIIGSNCVAKSAVWFSGMLERASKTAAEIGKVQNYKKK